MKETADEFAARSHSGQVRKYTGEPYIVHPRAVRALVSRFPHTPEMLDAAVLHDTVEDTDATLEDVLYAFGAVVMQMVADLTDISTPEDGNRAQRKAKDRLHTAAALPNSKTIKLADLIHNTGSIIAHDPAFARVYLKEKALLLQVLTEADPGMYALAVATLNEAEAKLEIL